MVESCVVNVWNDLKYNSFVDAGVVGFWSTIDSRAWRVVDWDFVRGMVS